jgi:acyl-coenzyme A synthetase/AMP-(fatty) acid ligase
VAELPKTVSGKTQRYRLRQRAQENPRSRSA